uniref:Autophagy-related protein 9 n=1 Tax=Trichuris muris TaxID=70415 RepID=A0A5S6QXF1_TRIMR
MPGYVRLNSVQGYQNVGEPSSSQCALAGEPTFAPDQTLPAAKDAHSNWQHVQNLDEFFTHIYEYHQRHGFYCLLLSDLLELFQFIFVVSFAVILATCVDYSMLFNGFAVDMTKASLWDVIDCSSSGTACSLGNPWMVVAIIIACVFWLHRLVRLFYRCTVFLDIRNFYYTALKVEDSMLRNMTWYDVQDRLCDENAPYKLCIQKSHLTSMDIYQRILRRKNYLVAMFNKGLLPARLKLPLIGDVCFMTLGFKFNLELLFFWGPWSPWENYWQLKADYKRRDGRQKLKDDLSRVILWFALANLVLAPLIFVWQILYCLFTYVEMLKREPSILGTRKWSMYGRYFFRHFNELDHELDNRLCYAYKPASLYMQMFYSSTAEIIAKNVAFVASAIFSVFFILSIYDEDVLRVHNVLQLLTISGCIVAACNTFIQDENAVFCPEMMMNTVLAYVHYLPSSWRAQAHSEWVRREFARFYQYRFTFILEELLSPIVCPFVLLLWLRPSAGLFVDFFRNFTVEVSGLGDVCSLAQVDLRHCGDPAYHMVGRPPPKEGEVAKARHGKVEMSLLHFISTNPRWEPPGDAVEFLNSFRAQADKDARSLEANGEALENPLAQSLYTYLTPNVVPSYRMARGPGVSKSAVPLAESSQLSSLTASGVFASTFYQRSHSPSVICLGAPFASTGGSTGPSHLLSLLSPVNLDILYLHELHKRRQQAGTYGSIPSSSVEQLSPFGGRRRTSAM